MCCPAAGAGVLARLSGSHPAAAITAGAAEFARLHPTSATHTAALAALTPREVEVLRLIAAGLSNSEIAGRLVVPRTERSR